MSALHKMSALDNVSRAMSSELGMTLKCRSWLATADQVDGLIDSQADGDDAHLYSVPMQAAARVAQSGQARFAQDPRELFGRSGGADLLCQFKLTQLGCQSILTGVDIGTLAANLSSDDPAIGLRASLALHRLAERVEAHHVAAAREKGWTWQQIGDALGVTRQSVHTKYNKESS
jgi:hypothetical protein